MSRLSALKEYAFMQVLRKHGFNVPEPVAQSRHTVVMELIDASPLRQILAVPDPAGLYAKLIDVIVRLAKFGLIHGDFNEFNILMREDGVSPDSDSRIDTENNDEVSRKLDSGSTETKATPTYTPIIIDFPQMVSIDHANAETYFNRDVACIKRFFERRFNFISDAAGPEFGDVKKSTAASTGYRLDVEAEASGFSKKMAKELYRYTQAVGIDGQPESENEEDGFISADESSNDSHPDTNDNNEACGPQLLHTESVPDLVPPTGRNASSSLNTHKGSSETDF